MIIKENRHEILDIYKSHTYYSLIFHEKRALI
jgi:hypothetical protein